MNHPGPVAIGTGCECGHIHWRPTPHPDSPRDLRKATALVSARLHVGYRPLIGVAVYQAITENA